MDDPDTELAYGNEEADKALTEVIDNSVWRKATLVDGKAYWATESAGGIGEPVMNGNFKIRHMGDYVLLAPLDDGDPTDHEARDESIKKANDDRVAAFIQSVTDRLLAFHGGRTEPENGRIGAFKVFTKDTANAIIDKIVRNVANLQAEHGRTVDSQALRASLDGEIVRAVLLSNFTELLPDLLVDGALVTDVHGYVDDDFDNPGPEMREDHQAISDGLLSLKHRELDAVRQKVMRSNVESLLPSLGAMNVEKDDEGYDSDSSRVSQDHCRISPYYPSCEDECWLHSVHHDETAVEGELAKAPETSPPQIYESLEPDCIRILTIQPGLRDAKVSCNLSIHSMSVLAREKPEETNLRFQALSYTWGDPTPRYTIECNEKDFLVAQNLYHALRYLRLVDRPVLFWIDAICINQNDLAEKSQQIRHMFQVYQLATQVVVWLGIHCDNSELAMRSIKHLANSDNRGALLRRDHGRECIESLKEVVKSLETLFRRQWFERSWIRQEVSAARRVVVRCGDDEFAWGRLKRISSCMWRLQEKILSSISENADTAHPPTLTDEFRSSPLRFLKRKLFAGQSLLSDTGDVRSLWYYHAGGFLDHLMVSRAFQATNPRDKVYAVLGIADVPIESDETPDSHATDALKMRVDYGATVSEVYQYTAKFIINRDRNLDVLCILSTHRDEYSTDLPTWTPDWRVPTSSFPLYTNWDYFSYKFGAAGFTECQRQDQDDVGILVVKGFPLTAITELVPVAITSIPHPPEELTGSGETLDYAKHHRQLALTRSGNAIVPVQTEVGDEVWVLWGCKLPIVLRLVAEMEETNQLFCAVVGPCYVPTYMWGRGVKEFLEFGEEPQEISLV